MLRIIAILIFCFVLVNLVMGLISLLKDRGESTRMVKALTWRIGLSLGLFIMIIIAAFLGVFPE